jgi:hypothetical protein
MTNGRLESPSKTFYALEPVLQSALVAVIQRLCPSPVLWWREPYRPRDDYNTAFEDAQTRSLLWFLAESCKKAREGKSRMLFDAIKTNNRFFQLAIYLRDCCNKHRYNSLNQAEELADFLLFDEFLLECSRLAGAGHQDIDSCRKRLGAQIASLMEDVAEAKGITIELADDAATVIPSAPSASEELKAQVAAIADAIPTMAGSTAAMRDELRGLHAAIRAAQEAKLAPAVPPGGGGSNVAEEEEVRDVSPLDAEGLRGRLIALRREIWNQLGVRASPDGILRKRLLDSFIKNRITTQGEFATHVSASEREQTDKRQLNYLPRIFELVDRLPRDAVLKDH